MIIFVKMRKEIIALILTFLLLGMVIASNLKKPDIKTDLTIEQKKIMKQKFNATGYKVEDCWWDKKCYFCNIAIGNLTNKRAITCNFEEDRKVYREEDCLRKPCSLVVVDILSMQDLIDKDVIQIVQAHTKEKKIKPDDKGMKGKIKKW